MAREYVVDERGKRSKVILSVKEYQELLEDLEDLALIAERKDEPTSPIEDVRKRLEEKWRDSSLRSE